MEFDWVFFAVAIPAVLFAGISKGGFGSGAAFAATPMLALVIEPGAAIGIMLPLLIVMDFTALKPYWRQWHGPSAKLLILGGLPGIAAGAALYSVADPDLFRLLIGLIALGFVAFQFSRGRGWIRPARRPMGSVAGLSFGAGAGLTSFIAHAGGPVAAIYLLSMRLSKLEYQATTVIVFWASNLIKAVPYIALGIISLDTAWAGLYLVPFAFIGVWLGVWLHRIVPEQLFFALVYVFLTAAGVRLLWMALV